MESNSIFFPIVGTWRTVIGQTCHVSQFSNCKNDAAKVGGPTFIILLTCKENCIETRLQAVSTCTTSDSKTPL